jgi:hypothetical protein
MGKIMKGSRIRHANNHRQRKEQPDGLTDDPRQTER